MPYIHPKEHARLDPHIIALASELKACEAQAVDIAGLLNYTRTTLLLATISSRHYWSIALATGVLHNILDEFYRRYAVPYEDEKILQNGDAYPSEDT